MTWQQPPPVIVTTRKRRTVDIIVECGNGGMRSTMNVLLSSLFPPLQSSDWECQGEVLAMIIIGRGGDDIFHWGLSPHRH